MKRAELVSYVAAKAGLTRREAAGAVDAVVAAVGGALAAGGRIRVDGLGIFEVVQRAPRVGRNPRTGERVNVPARRAVRYRPAKSLGDSVV